MKKKNTLQITLLVLTALMVGIFSSISKPAVNLASKKAYCAKLKLNNNLKLNKTKTFEKTGIYQENTFFPTKVKSKIKYTVSCKKKLSGKNYKVTYNVKYNFTDNPKINTTSKQPYDDWNWGFTQPFPIYTVFDYQTGLSLENKNKKNVTIKDSDWKFKYYPKQYYKYSDEIMQDNKDYKEKDLWLRNYKTINYSFTITYPKNYKDVVVGIGFVNTLDYPSDYPDWNNDSKYFSGKKITYDKTTYYKNGKNTMSYMRLQ